MILINAAVFYLGVALVLITFIGITVVISNLLGIR
jgi:hypothetical protein